MQSVERTGLEIKAVSKGFELFQQEYPAGLIDKAIIRLIYWKYRGHGDVIALLMEKS